MRLAIASVAKFDFELCDTDVDDFAYKHDFQVAHGKLESEGVRAMVRGQAEGL